MPASEDGTHDAETRIDIEAAMQRLPCKYRATAVAYYLGGCSCREIAASEGVSRGAVYYRLRMARRILVEWLA